MKFECIASIFIAFVAFGSGQYLWPWTLQMPYDLPLVIHNNSAVYNLTTKFTVSEFPDLMELIPSTHPFLYEDYIKYDWRRESILSTLTGTSQFFNPFWNLFKALRNNTNTSRTGEQTKPTPNKKN